MPAQTLVFWLIADPITFGLGSIGAYILFNEFAAFDHFPTWQEILQMLKKRWVAIFALAIAILYFFYRLFDVLEL
jgi:hypothetical protein